MLLFAIFFYKSCNHWRLEGESWPNYLHNIFFANICLWKILYWGLWYNVTIVTTLQCRMLLFSSLVVAAPFWELGGWSLEVVKGGSQSLGGLTQRLTLDPPTLRHRYLLLLWIIWNAKYTGEIQGGLAGKANAVRFPISVFYVSPRLTLAIYLQCCIFGVWWFIFGIWYHT